jgi:hypothetical protein
MCKFSVQTIGMILLAVPAWGEPRQWIDDFKTAATYDSVSLYGPCNGGASTKYTMLEAYTGNIYNERSVSGDGSLRITSRSIENGLTGSRYSGAAVGVIDFGQTCPDNPNPAPGAQLITSEPFSNNDVCIYAATEYTPWHLRHPDNHAVDGRYGNDGQPGIAGVDDDLDGVTDEANECLSLRPTTVSQGYGHRGSNAYQAGRDSAPGIAGVDDDGNGVIDDYGEIGSPGSDDGDDRFREMRHFIMKGNFNSTSFVYFNFDISTNSENRLSINDVVNAGGSVLAGANEIAHGFYQAYTQYNYAFCVSGTCYGAMLWTGPDIANPDETLGPAVSSHHTGPADNIVAFAIEGFVALYHRQIQVLGNTNFHDSLWIVSGPAATHYPSPSADLDRDKDVDGFDFLTFSNCYNGSNRPPLAACADEHADLDRDGDVDGFDFLTFSNCYNGSNRKPLAACFPPNLTACGS